MRVRTIRAQLCGMCAAGAAWRAKSKGLDSASSALPPVLAQNEFKCLIDAPGLDKEDLGIEVDGDVLRVSVQRQPTRCIKGDDENSVQWHRADRTPSRGSQSLRFPDSADMGSVQAELSNGLLSVCIKKKATLRRRQLQIGGGQPLAQQQQQQQQEWPGGQRERLQTGDTQRVPITGAGQQPRGFGREEEPSAIGAGGGGRGMEQREQMPSKVGEKIRGTMEAGGGIATFPGGELGLELGTKRGYAGEPRTQEYGQPTGVSGGMRETYPGAEAAHLVKGPTYGEATSPGTVTGGERKKETAGGILEPEAVGPVATPSGKEGMRREGLVEEEAEPRHHKGLGERLKEVVGLGGEHEKEREQGYGGTEGVSRRGGGAATVVHATQPEVLRKFGETPKYTGTGSERERGREREGERLGSGI